MNCTAALQIGDDWPIADNESCYLQGVGGECKTDEFTGDNPVLYAKMLLGYFHPRPSAGTVTLVDVGYTVPDDQTWAPCECPFGCSTNYTN
jgi:hypothetical protein